MTKEDEQVLRGTIAGRERGEKLRDQMAAKMLAHTTPRSEGPEMIELAPGVFLRGNRDHGWERLALRARASVEDQTPGGQADAYTDPDDLDHENRQLATPDAAVVAKAGRKKV